MNFIVLKARIIINIVVINERKGIKEMEELKKSKYEMRAFLKTPTDVKELSQMANIVPRNIEVKALHDNFVVNARSILGLFSLNLSEPITLIFDSVYGSEEFLNNFNEWRV